MDIAFVGLGRMGLPMATRLLAAGYTVIGHDVNADRLAQFQASGGLVATSLEDVATADRTVLVSLPTPSVVREVALGGDGLLAHGGVRGYIDLSTTGVHVATEVADQFSSRGIPVLDAPVSGGVRGAANGTLAIMAAGSRALFEEVHDILNAIGGNIFYVGPHAGQGQAMKLVNNMMSATALAITSEGLVLGVKAGLDPTVMLEVLNAGSGRNSATDDKFPNAVLPRTFNQGFATALLHKDLRLCLELAEQLGVPMWVGSTVYQLWTFALSQGGGQDDFTTIVRYFEQWAAVEVRPQAEVHGRGGRKEEEWAS